MSDRISKITEGADQEPALHHLPALVIDEGDQRNDQRKMKAKDMGLTKITQFSGKPYLKTEPRTGHQVANPAWPNWNSLEQYHQNGKYCVVAVFQDYRGTVLAPITSADKLELLNELIAFKFAKKCSFYLKKTKELLEISSSIK